MSEKKVLFSLNTSTSNVIEDNVKAVVKKNFDIDVDYSREYYTQGIIKSLQESDFNILILNENLEAEPIQPEFMDMITDNFPKLRTILIIEDKHKNDAFIKKIFSLGVYDCIYKSDLTIDFLSELIHTARNKKDAKDYYGLDNSLESLEEVVTSTGLAEIPDDELPVVLDNFNNATEDNIRELFDLAEQTYKFPQMVFLISILKNNPSVCELLKNADCNIKKYEKVLNRDLTKTIVKEKINNVVKIVEKPVEVIKEVEIEKVVEKPIEVEKIIEKEVVKEVYKTPSDYKKIIAVVGGSRKVGATTLIELLSYSFSKNGRKVGILDFTDNKDLFEKYLFYGTDEDDRWKPLNDLVNGIDKPYMFNKNCRLYTSIPTSSYNLKQMLQCIDSIKANNDIVLIDLPLRLLEKVYLSLDRVMIVISQNLMNTKYLSNVLSGLIYENKLPNYDVKIKFIINKYLNDFQIQRDKDLIDCYTTTLNNYLDTTFNEAYMNYNQEIFKVNFSLDILKNSYIVEETQKNINEEVEKQIYEICLDMYPVLNKTNKAKAKNFIGNFFRRKV